MHTELINKYSLIENSNSLLYWHAIVKSLLVENRINETETIHVGIINECE